MWLHTINLLIVTFELQQTEPKWSSLGGLDRCRLVWSSFYALASCFTRWRGILYWPDILLLKCFLELNSLHLPAGRDWSLSPDSIMYQNIITSLQKMTTKKEWLYGSNSLTATQVLRNCVYRWVISLEVHQGMKIYSKAICRGKEPDRWLWCLTLCVWRSINFKTWTNTSSSSVSWSF